MYTFQRSQVLKWVFIITYYLVLVLNSIILNNFIYDFVSRIFVDFIINLLLISNYCNFFFIYF